jgi:hypothetical protein
VEEGVPRGGLEEQVERHLAARASPAAAEGFGREAEEVRVLGGTRGRSECASRGLIYCGFSLMSGPSHWISGL